MKILRALPAVLLLASCGGVDYQKTSKGVPYKVFTGKNGQAIKQNNVVQFQVIQKIGDTVVYSTYTDGNPQLLEIPATIPGGSQPGGSYADIRGTILEILPKVKSGDSLYIVQSVDSLVKVNPQLANDPLIKKGKELITTVKVEKVFASAKDADAVRRQSESKGLERMNAEAEKKFKSDPALQAQLTKDAQSIESYLQANSIQAQKVGWGTYVQMLQPGTGEKPKYGQFVNIQYQGTNFQGKEFDKGVFPIQYGMLRTVPGFEQGIGALTKGSRAKLYIPSALAYGSAGSPPRIAPNENLIFNITILDISDTPPVPQPQSPEPLDTTHAGHNH